jgi:digeranylgeranylglycerophospholipid reductase
VPSAHEFDLAVVGASFAGLACAEAAAARGLSTVVLDRKPEPGAKVRTTGILVKEVADAWDVPRRLTRKIRGIRLYGPGLGWADLTSPGYYFLATDTPQLLRWLTRRATAAGAQVRGAAVFQGPCPPAEACIFRAAASIVASWWARTVRGQR